MERTINEVFQNRTIKYQDRLAIEKKRGGKWESASWNQYYARARLTGLGLYHQGIRKADRVSLLSENRLEWLYTDMGCLGIGACLIPVYTTLTADEVCYIVENSESKILVVEDSAQLDKAMFTLSRCSCLEKIVVIEKGSGLSDHLAVMSFDSLLEAGRDIHKQDSALFERLSGGVEPGDPATIVYTSGTTGVPKGAMITHGNIMAVLRSLDAISPKFGSDSDVTVPFLPLSHVFERAAGHFYGMYIGITASYAESVQTVLEDFKEKQPTMILAVPRVCEKVYQRILTQVQSRPGWRQKVFWWAHGIGAAISSLRENRQPIPAILKLQYRIAFELVFKKLRLALGGRVRWMTASGAPTSRDIILFFNAAGITVVEGYGMTECFAPATMSNLADYRIGTVGRPLPGVDIRIAGDGEILIKGDNVFAGYWKMEQETREAFTSDGYLKSGDIGFLDKDGFLTITDRKKNLIITSGGKNIAPQKIENLFMSDPLFSHFIVIGERRRFLTALITLNWDQAEQVAAAEGLMVEKPEALLNEPRFKAIVDRHVDAKNLLLARFETIKKYRIVGDEFSQATGELTPSLKLKRNVVLNRYDSLIEDMYSE
ncbi:MAG: long-chain fatty acid--CoA ligase [Pseudomonadota bacterium]